MFRILIASVLVSLCVCFNGFPHTSIFRGGRDVRMATEGRKCSKDVKIATGILAFLSSVSISIAPVSAANYGGFGSKYTAVIDSKDAVVNSETINSDEVKSAYQGVKNVLNTVTVLKADLAKDNQLDVGSRLQSDFKVGEIRSTLNKYNSGFSEETQLASDRLTRNFLQDLIELSRESKVKPGKTRADTKLAAINKRLTAAQSALSELLSYYPN